MLHKSSRLVLIGLSMILALTLLVGGSTHALSGSEFQAGRIIDDGVFYEGSSVTATEIQNFLNAKVLTCDTWGQQMYNSTQTRAQYGESKGYTTPYTCLKDYRQDTGYKAGQSGLCSAIEAKTNRSAAQIIDDVARACHISQKVIIVMLQKEQGLITDDWPWSIQYRSAMGYGCPDTAACNSEYYGFFNQVYNAALQFQRYKADPNNWNHVPFMNNQVLYQANAPSCGSRTTYIENYATAGLYNYTPYTPNAAALNNLYGTGDGCSAYGNRNFWRYYNDWFGSTYAGAYQARFHGQTPTPTEPYYLGEPRQVYIDYKNSGTARWYDDASVPAGLNSVHLAASNPINRQSVFSYGWPSAGRPNFTFSKVYEADGATLAANQHVVEPGQVARFEFNITAPWNVGLETYREHFQPVLEGAQDWNMGGLAWLDIKVVSRYSAIFHSQSEYPTIDQHSDQVANYFRFKNSGSAAWYDTTSVPTGYHPTQLSTAPIGRQSTLSSGWPSKTVAAKQFSKVYEADGATLAANQHVVMPGQIGEFSFNMVAGEHIDPGVIRERFQPVTLDQYHPSLGVIAWQDVTVKSTTKKATFHSQSVFPTIERGQGIAAFLQYKNSGTARWYDDASVPAGLNSVHLAASNPINRQSVFSYGWPSAGRPNFTFSKVYEADGATLAANQHVVEPGQVARFEFNITAPWNVGYGTHREYFQPVLEGASQWSIGALSWLDVTIQ